MARISGHNPEAKVEHHQAAVQVQSQQTNSLVNIKHLNGSDGYLQRTDAAQRPVS